MSYSNLFFSAFLKKVVSLLNVILIPAFSCSLFSLNINDLPNYHFHWLDNVPFSDMSSLFF